LEKKEKKEKKKEDDALLGAARACNAGIKDASSSYG
jgi:hypothetical protein